MDFESETFVTHSLRGDGFDASEDGTGRGTPLVPVMSAEEIRKPRMVPTRKGDKLRYETSNEYWTRQNEMLPVVAVGSQTMALNFRGRKGGTQAELGGNVATALRCGGGTSSKSHAMVGMAVRHLTPRECEALQGFPPDYTKIDANTAAGPRATRRSATPWPYR